MEATRIFDGELLRADLFNPDAEHLFVSFRQGAMQPGAFDTPSPVKSFVRNGYAHLHVQTRLKDWYVNDETPALEPVLTEAARRYRRRVSIGFSMGGYGVLRFSGALSLRRVVLVAPQFSIAPDTVPFDRRRHGFADAFDQQLGDLPSHGRARLHGVVLVDPLRRLDMAHAALVTEAFPRLALCRLAGAGHSASQVLREGGHYRKLLTSLQNRTPPQQDIIAWHRASRRESGLYWAELARAADDRNRPGLAQIARAQAKRLGTKAEAVSQFDIEAHDPA